MGTRTGDGWERGQWIDGARTGGVWMGVRTGDGWELGQGMGGSEGRDG